MTRIKVFLRLPAVVSTAAVLLATTAFAADGEPAPGADPEVPADTDYVEYVDVDVEGQPESNTISRKLGVDVDRTPVHVSRVGRALIDEQDGRVLGDALMNVAGVNVVPFSGTFDAFTIRGYDSVESGVVLTDGVVEPESSFHRTYNVQGVEVLKGPGGFLYGSSPLAGVVNVLRKQPLPVDFGVFRVRGGSWGELEGAFDWNESTDDGDLAFRFNGTVGEGDGWRDRTEHSHVGINPTLAWSPRESLRFNFAAEYVNSDHGPDNGIPLLGDALPDVDRRTSYQSPFDRSEQGVTRFQVDLEYDVGERVTIRNKTYYRRLQWLSDGTIFTAVFPDPGTFEPTVGRLLLALDDDQRFWGNQFEAVAEVATGPVRHRILGGLELARRDDTYTLRSSCPAGTPGCDFLVTLPNISLLDPVETATERPTLLPFDQIDPGTPGAGDSRATIVAPYVIDQMSFGDRFDLMIGLRYDTIDFQDDATGADRSDADLSPTVGAVWTAATSTALFANAGSTFAPAGPRVTGSPDPEETDQIEIGVRQELPDGFGRLTLAAFRLDRTNIAILDDNGFSQQQGDQTTDGVELEFAFEPFRNTLALLTYAYMDAELTRFTEGGIVGFDPNTFEPIFGVLDRSGNVPAFVPEHLATLWVRHTLGRGFQVAGGVRYVGSQFIDEDNAVRIDPATIVDASVSWTTGPLKVQLNLRNVTDEEYSTRGFSPISVTPGTPFSVTGGVEYRF